MGQEVLVDERIDAGAEFVRQFNDYASVAAAFWINPAESGEWYLYIASDEIDDSNVDVAYAEVGQRLRGSASSTRPWLDPFRIKLISAADPLASEVVHIRDRFPTTQPTWYHGTSIAGMGIGEAYIYPPLAATKSAP